MNAHPRAGVFGESYNIQGANVPASLFVYYLWCMKYNYDGRINSDAFFKCSSSSKINKKFICI